MQTASLLSKYEKNFTRGPADHGQFSHCKSATRNPQQIRANVQTHLTCQSDDLEKPSCKQPGEVNVGRFGTNCKEAKEFQLIFFKIRSKLNRDLRVPSHKNEEILAGQPTS